MERSLRQITPSVHWAKDVTLDGLCQTISSPRIEAILVRFGVSEKRVRKLNMVLVVWLCIAMNLYTEEAIEDVYGTLEHRATLSETGR
jgi:hypothetical protein